jgi:hypothetical protein
LNHQDETNKGTAPSPAPELEALYLEHFPTIKSAIHEAFPGLNFLEVGSIMGRLSNRLHRFQGTAAEFPKLATQYALNWGQHQSLYLLCVTHPKNVKAIESAIHANLYDSVIDCAFSRDDLFSEVALWLYSHVNGFIPKATDTAALSTRLFELTKTHVFFHNAKRFRRYNIVAENVTTLGVAGTEFLSPMELASVRSDEGEGEDAA